MRKSAFSLICALVVTMCACSGNEKTEEAQQYANTERDDSLRTALAEKDSLLSLFATISEGIYQIKEMENLLSVSNLSNESPSRKQEIINDIKLIKLDIESRRRSLENLEARLSKSNNYNEEMKKTIEALRSQIAMQEETIANLQAELAAANIKISDLNKDVDSLITRNAETTIEKKAAQEESIRLNNALNTCYYVIGSKNELKEHKIIESGFLRKTKVMESDYELSYFTRADKRTLNEIPLHSKKAKVLSKHPADSYQIVTDGDSKTLVINNRTKFWELSNYLIIQIN